MNAKNMNEYIYRDGLRINHTLYEKYLEAKANTTKVHLCHVRAFQLKFTSTKEVKPC
jgi:hypothetical protein